MAFIHHTMCMWEAIHMCYGFGRTHLFYQKWMRTADSWGSFCSSFVEGKIWLLLPSCIIFVLGLFDCGKTILANNSCGPHMMQFYFSQNMLHADMGLWEFLCSHFVSSICISQFYILGQLFLFFITDFVCQIFFKKYCRLFHYGPFYKGQGGVFPSSMLFSLPALMGTTIFMNVDPEHMLLWHWLRFWRPSL